MAPIDPHSFVDSSHPLCVHADLALFFDFPSAAVRGSVLLSLAAPHAGPLYLDARSVAVSAATDPATGASVAFAVSQPDAVKGECVTLSLTGQSSVLLSFSTSPSSSALQWLSPPQTFNKTHPFVYTQCQSIHARSIFPCQVTSQGFSDSSQFALERTNL